MATTPVLALWLLIVGLLLVEEVHGTGTWCMARSNAGQQSLQKAIDYACGAGGANCSPIQPTGLCFLSNTLQAHASYAFNGYYQSKFMAPGSCDFAATATIATSDPSYGISTAGGTASSTPTSPATTTSTPTTTTVPAVLPSMPTVFIQPTYGSSIPNPEQQLSQWDPALPTTFLIITRLLRVIV